jgi:hypothetical protein
MSEYPPMEAILKIDKNGRIDLPPAILDALQINTPTEVRAQATEGNLQITTVKSPGKVAFTNEKGVLVAINSTEFDATDAIDSMRASRM